MPRPERCSVGPLGPADRGDNAIFSFVSDVTGLARYSRSSRSQAASREGSQNLAGIADPAVDALIDRIIFAKDRDELVAATKALDRVLLAHDYVVPQWTSLKQRTARWDRYSHPENMPRYGGAAFPTIWWYDEAKAARTGAPR